MAIYSLGDLRVTVASDNFFVADNATVVGDVELGDGVNIWFNAVLRADCDRIVIGDHSNVQDGAMIHTDPGSPTILGRGVTVGHHAVVHGCTVGDYSLVGINAVVLTGAKIGKRCLIGANALIPERMVIPDGSLVVGAPAVIKRQLSEEMQKGLELSASHYVENGARFRRELKLDERFGK
jgi:carbonic anhydrase/acetyltransferase-like protein (isoleucine patch superfamily)